MIVVVIILLLQNFFFFMDILECENIEDVVCTYFEVVVTQNLVDHEALSIACHEGLHVVFIHSNLLGPVGPQALV